MIKVTVVLTEDEAEALTRLVWSQDQTPEDAPYVLPRMSAAILRKAAKKITAAVEKGRLS